MLILGLCVAHDAGVALLDDGRVVGLVQRERLDRLKRSALITPDFLQAALAQLGVVWADIDVIAISTCQSWPFLFTEPDRFHFEYDPRVADDLPLQSSVKDIIRQTEPAFERHRDQSALRASQISAGLYGEYFSVDTKPLAKAGYHSVCVEWPVVSSHWVRRLSAERVDTRSIVAENLPRSRPQLGYVTARVTFDGVERPGVLVPHHLAHAAYSFYQSGEERAAIATLDNGDCLTPTGGYTGGILAVGEGTSLTVLDFRFAYEGHLYQRIGESVGLGSGGAAGKLMGLAPYGEPAYYDQSMVADAVELFGADYARGGKQDRSHVIKPLLDKAAAGHREDGGDLDRRLEGVDGAGLGADDVTYRKTRLAASAQKVMEENTLATLRAMHAGFADAGRPVEAVVLSGGVALNCPANTRAAQ